MGHMTCITPLTRLIVVIHNFEIIKLLHIITNLHIMCNTPHLEEYVYIIHVKIKKLTQSIQKILSSVTSILINDSMQYISLLSTIPT